MSLELKPHLREVDELFRKITDFESAVRLKHSYRREQNDRRYYGEDIDAVVEAFSERMDFSPEELKELQAVMRGGTIDFMRLVHDREAVPEDEYQLLYIISRPFFRAFRDVSPRDDVFWDGGRCPVCSALPSLSAIEQGSQRKYVCSFCGTLGYFKRIGCPACLTENPRDITIISLEGEGGMRADTCENCGSYSKTFESSLVIEYSFDFLDILSIPFDIVAQEKGFKRQSPNPVGLIGIG